MNKPVVLTGIKSTGHPHLGNYIGAIKPALEMVFDVINRELEKPRERYQMYMENKQLISDILQQGAKRARQQASMHLQQIKKSIGY